MPRERKRPPDCPEESRLSSIPPEKTGHDPAQWDDSARARTTTVPRPLPPTHQVWALRAALFVLTAVFLVGNVLHLQVNDPHEPTHPVFSHPGWNGDYDGSHVEIFGHIELTLAAAVLFALAFSRRVLVYGAWALTVAALTVDDLMQVHERGGAVLVTALDLPAVAGLRPQDLGELAVWGILALVLGMFLLVGYLRAPGYARRDSWILVACLLVLVVFGVIIDQLLIIVAPRITPLAYHSLVLTETAGEIVAMTLILLAAHQMAVRPRQATVVADRGPEGDSAGEG